MYKVTLKLSIIAFTLISSVSTYAWTDSSGKTFCPGDTSSINGQKQIPITNNVTATLSGTLNCETHGYYGGILRPGGPSGWRPKNSNYVCPNDEYASSIVCRLGSTDVPCSDDGTGWDRYKIFCKFMDDTPPTVTDITNSNPLNLLAGTRSYSISIGVNGGSPIETLRYRNENRDTQGFTPNTTITAPNPWSFLWNMEKVDGNTTSNEFRQTNGARQYTYRITQICDQAGNCWVGDQIYNHNVYADTTSITSSVLTNQLSSSIVADGTAKNVTIHLQDQYGNDIIPASGISRTVDIEVLADNDLRLDQYDNTGTDTAFFVDINYGTGAIAINSISPIDLGSRPSINGDYTIPFYVYAPTSNTNPLVPGNAGISSIRYDINGTTGVFGDIPQNQTIPSSAITISASPLYTTVLSGEVRTQGFIEGATQDLDIAVTKANGKTTDLESLRTEFGDVVGGINVDNDRYDFRINGSSIWEGNNVWGNTTQLSSLSTLNNNITLMTQDLPVESESFSYLASIVKYRNDNKIVVYPADIIGKDSYHGTAGGINSYQEGVKITGNTSSETIEEITNDQFTDDIRILGKLTKSTFRRDINQKVFSVTRNIPDATLENNFGNVGNLGDASEWTSSNNDGLRIYGDQVLFFRGQDVTIAGDTIEGNKTLLVEDGDVYISGDILGSGLLGIIVIDGDILIDNRVNDIHAVLYTNQSVLSTTDGTTSLDGNTSAELLKEQLYVYGSLFSENTIGGSRKDTPECPYYINSACDQVEAQTYDLNYLRRYYRYGDDLSPIDGIPDNESGDPSAARGQSGFENFPVIIDYNPAIQETPPPFFD